jgi:hypothetical protein
VLDFDVWQLWMIDVLEKFGECGARHKAIVDAWPK